MSSGLPVRLAAISGWQSVGRGGILGFVDTGSAFSIMFT